MNPGVFFCPFTYAKRGVIKHSTLSTARVAAVFWNTKMKQKWWLACIFSEFVLTRSSLPSLTRLRSHTPRSFSGAGGTIGGRLGLTRPAIPIVLRFFYFFIFADPRQADNLTISGMESLLLFHIKSVTKIYLRSLQYLYNLCIYMP